MLSFTHVLKGTKNPFYIAIFMNSSNTKFLNFFQYMTILFGSALLVFLMLLPVYANAAATFNTNPADFQTLRVMNKTDNPNSTTAWATTAGADAGEIISFAIYYHNTSNETAQNVRIKLSSPSGAPGATQTFTATLSADNASAITGSAIVIISSSQTVTFIPGTVIWRPNQTVFGSSALPFGQNGSEIFNGSGLNIGNILPGWGTQGSVVLNMQVSNNGGSGQNGGQAIITTNTASAVSQNSALLNGFVNPNNSNTNAWFEWGQTTNFGNSVSSQSMGSGSSQLSYSYNLTGLQQNTTYYYRAVASNSFGTVYGTMYSFTTTGFNNNNNNGNGGNSAPFASTNSASILGNTYGTMNGTVNPNGTQTSAWFEWGLTPSLGNSVSSQSIGSGFSQISYQFNLSGLQQNTTYYYRAVASNTYGTSYGNTVSFISSSQYQNTYTSYGGSLASVSSGPTFSITNTSTTFGGSVSPNNSFTTVWFEYGTTMGLGSSVGQQSIGSGAVSTSVSYNVSGLQQGILYYYRVVASNSYGTNYGDIVSFRTQGGVTGGNPAVTTNFASGIGQTSTTLNGTVSTPNESAQVWFEWGTTALFGNRTTEQLISNGFTNRQYSATLFNLQPGTSYFYRAVVQSASGPIRYGDIVSFTTVRRTVVLTATTPPQPVAPTPQSPIVFASAINQHEQATGEKFNYTLVYKNASSGVINNVTIRTSLPSGVTYEGASLQPSSRNGNDLIFTIGNVAPDSQSTISVTVTADNSLQNKTVITFSASMDYTDTTNTVKTLQAPLSVTVTENLGNADTNGLTAAIFGAFGSLLGNWINIFLLIVVAFLGYTYFVRQKAGFKA